MIVDDDADVCQFAKSLFERKGFSVSIAAGGTEALAVFNDQKPRMVLLDVKMPSMDGIALLRELKKRDPDVDVIMISGVADTDVIEDAKRFGAYHYVTKPLVLEELESIVVERAEWLKAREKP